MQFQLTPEPLSTARVDALILPIMSNVKTHPTFLRDIDQALDGELIKRLQEVAFKGEWGQVFVMHTLGKIGPKTLYITGMGPTEKFAAKIARKAYAAATRKVIADKGKSVAILYLENESVPSFFASSVEGILLGAYSFNEYRQENADEPRPTIERTDVHFIDKTLAEKIQKELTQAQAVAEGINLTRNIVNRPARDVFPEAMAELCLQLFKQPPYSVNVWNETEIKKNKMGAFLSVAQGSPKPPRFIHLQYKPEQKPKARIALVGKGVTFDTGGLSLKTPRHMMEMKCDKAGAAAVIGVFKALATLRPNLHIDGIIAATENIIGGDSTRPGDVVYAMSGKSIEVLNTDAEGRLTLADALGYACSLPGVKEVIDLATLTGACVIAVGDLMCAAMTNEPPMLARLKEAAEIAGEGMWELPLNEEYKEYIKGEIADIKNIGPEGGAAGTILGGLFLQEFVTKPWVHLDIAGPAFHNRDMIISPKGASGFGVGTLLNYLMRY